MSAMLRRVRKSEATQNSELYCFAEPVIGPAASGRTRWLAMTNSTAEYRASLAAADAPGWVPPRQAALVAPLAADLRRGAGPGPQPAARDSEPALPKLSPAPAVRPALPLEPAMTRLPLVRVSAALLA